MKCFNHRRIVVFALLMAVGIVIYAQSNIRLTKMQYYDRANASDSLVVRGELSYTYNAAGLCDTFWNCAMWDSALNNWKYRSFFQNRYNASGTLDSQFLFSYNNASSDWSYELYTYQYPLGTYDTLIYHFIYNTNYWAWDTFRTTSVYNYKLKPVVRDYRYMVWDNWLPVTKTLYTYDSADRIVTEEIQTTNCIDTFMSSATRKVFTYDASGKLVRLLHESALQNLNVWTPYYHLDYYYDSHNRLDSISTSNSPCITKYLYRPDGQVDSTLTYQQPDTGVVAPKLLGFDKYFYEEVSTGIAGIGHPSPDIRLFPNPATNSVTISIPEQLIGSTATVSDVMGRVVAAVTLTTGNRQLSTESFLNGLYFVTVGNRTQKLIVNH
jgi:hypothetical protein